MPLHQRPNLFQLWGGNFYPLNYIHPYVIVLIYILQLITTCYSVSIHSVCSTGGLYNVYTMCTISPLPPCLPSPHLPTFPVVLVLGVATSMTAIHRTLPRSTSSLLSIEQLHTQHSTLTLSHIIEEVNMQRTVDLR